MPEYTEKDIEQFLIGRTFIARKLEDIQEVLSFMMGKLTATLCAKVCSQHLSGQEEHKTFTYTVNFRQDRVTTSTSFVVEVLIYRGWRKPKVDVVTSSVDVEIGGELFALHNPGWVPQRSGHIPEHMVIPAWQSLPQLLQKLAEDCPEIDESIRFYHGVLNAS